jgi:hypothetical protein
MVIIFVVFSFEIAAGDKPKRTETDQKRWFELLKKDNASQKVEFYGKVIDQFDKPVENAEVTFDIDSYSFIFGVGYKMHRLRGTTRTDKNGCFDIGVVKKLKGATLSIRSLEKEGYVWQRDGNSLLSADYRNDGIKKDYTPDPKKPAIYHMRKKGANPTFLITEQYYNIEIEPDSSNLYSFLDLEADWENAGDNRDYKKDFLPKHYDIKVTSVFDKEKFDWIVTFTASGDNGGFILSDEFLSEAPEKGYKKEFKFIQHVLTEKEEDILSETEDRKVEEKYMKLREFVLKNKYLYIKSREPAIYTRMKLKDASIDVEWVNVSTSIATNPFGERNLEFNDELPYDITEKCEESVTEAFLKGKLPLNPNIKKMMREFKKTHKRVKNKYYGNYEWIKK